MPYKRAPLHRRPRVFIGPVEIAGYYGNLTRGLRDLGYDCDFFTYSSHAFGYGGESRPPVLLKIAKWFNRRRSGTGRSFSMRILLAVPGESFSALWGLFAIFRYDVYIFGFGRSLLPANWDLPILRCLGKTVIGNIGHGSEARPPFIDGIYQSKEAAPIGLRELKGYIKRNKRRVLRWSANTHFVIGAPFSNSQFSSTRFINFFALGIPFDGGFNTDDPKINGGSATDFQMKEGEPKSKSVRILHSPSHPAAKGTPHILRAVDNLRLKGYSIELDVVEGRPFSEVLTAIASCDLVVDQVFSDTPMAGFATEAAWFGKPSVVGGYGLDRLRRLIPQGMFPPSKTCHPEQIELAIESLIRDRELRSRLGKDAQEFVKSKWSTREVASRYAILIEGNIPPEWWVYPQDVVYLEGAGQSSERSKEVIRKLVHAYGEQALQISHRQTLQRAFIDFAGLGNQKRPSNS